MPPDRLSDEWFKQAQARPSAPPSQRPSALPPAEPAGHPVWSLVGGAIAGAVGGVVFVWVVTPSGGYPDQRAFAIGAAVGAMIGGLLGRLTRRLLRIVPRIVVGACFASALWLLAYAFVLLRFAPELARSLPLVTSIVAALSYGACVGALPPMRVRKERGRSI